MGDFNLPSVDWANGGFPGSHEYLNVCDSIFDYGLHQIVDSPTRKNYLLDLIIINDLLIVSELIVFPPIGNSDHNSIQFDLLVSSTSLSNRIVDIDPTFVSNPVIWYDFANTDWSVLRTALRSVDWLSMLRSSNEVEEVWNCFSSTFW